MSVFAAFVRRSFVVSAILMLAACGGGDGGKGGGASAPGFSVSPGSLMFNATSTSSPTPAPQTITVTVTGGTVYLAAFYRGPAIGSATFTITGPTTGVVTVYPASPATIGGGSYTGTVQIVGCNDVNCTSQVSGSPKDVAVTYQIPGLSVQHSLTYTVGNTPAPADLARQVSIGGSAGITWTVASNVAWLSVSPASGGVGSTLTASLVQTQLDAMNNGTYTGSIILTPSAGSAETITVTLTISRTQVSFVAPYVAISNTSAEVIIRGDNFNSVTIQNVKFGSTNATTFTVVSNTEIRATHPVLTAGSYLVQLDNSLGINRSLATLAVVNAPIYAATTLAYPNTTAKQPLEVIYDAERQALVVGVVYPSPGSSGDIFRYGYSSSGWETLPASSAFTAFVDVGLTIDGQKLLAVSNNVIREVDPTTLATVTTVTTMQATGTLAIANSGVAIIPSLTALQYSWRDSVLSVLGTYPGNSFYGGTPSASADGSRVVIVQGGGLTPPPSVVRYDASTGMLSATSLSLNQNYYVQPKLDRTASHIILNGYLVYDANYIHLGDLPAIAATAWAAVALSPNGTRAYRCRGDAVLHTYDLTANPVAGVYPEIGTGTTLPSAPGAYPKMAISPDGGTVFIAGSNGIVVQPVP